MPDETKQPEKQPSDAVVTDPPAGEVRTPVVDAAPDPAKPDASKTDPLKTAPPAPPASTVIVTDPPGVSENLTAAPPVVDAKPDPLKPAAPVTPATAEVVVDPLVVDAHPDAPKPDPLKAATPVTPVPAEVVAHPEGEVPVVENKDQKAVPAAPEPTATLGSATSTATTLPAADKPAAPNPAAPETDEEISLNSKFMSNKAMQDLLKHLDKKKLSDELIEVLANNEKGETRFDKDKDGHALLTLGANQHVIDFGKLPDGRDFIGVSQQHSNGFDEHDARALVALAKSNNWNSITVHGNDDQKGALWLEAQRQGVPVKDFAPVEGSRAWKQWNEVDLPKLKAKQEAEAAAAAGGAKIAPVAGTPVMGISEGDPAAAEKPAAAIPVTTTPAATTLPPPAKQPPKRATTGPGGP